MVILLPAEVRAPPGSLLQGNQTAAAGRLSGSPVVPKKYPTDTSLTSDSYGNPGFTGRAVLGYPADAGTSTVHACEPGMDNTGHRGTAAIPRRVRSRTVARSASYRCRRRF